MNNLTHAYGRIGGLIVLAGVVCALGGVQSLKLKVVLDGDVYEETVKGDMCSVLEAADAAIVRSALPFSSISVVPEMWTLYLKDREMPVLDCEIYEESFRELDVKDGEHVYLFRNYRAYEDPYFAAEYLKGFAKSFGERIRPPVRRSDASRVPRAKGKGKSKGKKRKATKQNGNELNELVGLLAKSFLMGDMAQAFGVDGSSDKAAVTAGDGKDIASAEGGAAKGAEGANGQANLLASLLNTFGGTLLENYAKQAAEAPQEEF